jgi:hypothetical protein
MNLAAFLAPGNRVDIRIHPEGAVALSLSMDEAATVIEKSDAGLLVELDLHPARGGKMVALLPWQSIAAGFVSIAE